MNEKFKNRKVKFPVYKPAPNFLGSGGLTAHCQSQRSRSWRRRDPPGFMIFGVSALGLFLSDQSVIWKGMTSQSTAQ